MEKGYFPVAMSLLARGGSVHVAYHWRNLKTWLSGLSCILKLRQGIHLDAFYPNLIRELQASYR